MAIVSLSKRAQLGHTKLLCVDEQQTAKSRFLCLSLTGAPCLILPFIS